MITRKMGFQVFVIALSFLLVSGCHRKDQPRSSALAPVKIRGLKDTVGYSYTDRQIRAIIELSERLENDLLRSNREKFGGKNWIAGISPHDDHLLAGRVYVHLFQNMNAKRYVIFGVAHKAADWGAQDVLIFDSYDCWQGPYGLIKVSDLRQEIIKSMPKEEYVVNDEWQAFEHSVEGILPFIQYYRRDAEVVSILVPYMNWERIDTISQSLATALANIIQKNGWELGKDIAFIFSNDGDHYGDEDWGGKNMAPFGADEAGYLMATKQDNSLIEVNLTGDVKGEKLKDFCGRVWGENNLREYKIRWCGRFSIPLGLNTTRILMEKLKAPPLKGYLLRYGTSYQLGKLPLDIGIGTTAPYNIHHWVGYSAIGYY